MSRRPATLKPGSPQALPLAFAASAAATAGLVRGLNAAPSVAWLISLTAFTLLAFAYDKQAAKANGRRVAEFDFLILTLLGGTAGAALGMALFRHKTVKTSFRSRFWSVVAFQILLLAAWFLRDHLLP